MGRDKCNDCGFSYHNGGDCPSRDGDAITSFDGTQILKCNKYKSMVESVELTKTMRHMQVCKELNSLYEAKNHDYGDSFAKVRNELGNVAILVRLYDKVERLKTLLMGADAKIKDESIEDSFKDLINYGIMELVERAVDKDGNK